MWQVICWLICIFLLWNCITLLVCRTDKRRAVKHRRRIAERTLFLLAICAGGCGMYAGMLLFRHKTRHWYFMLGMPLIALLQLAGLVWLCVWIAG